MCIMISVSLHQSPGCALRKACQLTVHILSFIKLNLLVFYSFCKLNSHLQFLKQDSPTDFKLGSNLHFFNQSMSDSLLEFYFLCFIL